MVTSMMVSPDGLLLLTGTASASVNIYRLSSLTLLTSLPPPTPSPGIDTLSYACCKGFAGPLSSLWLLTWPF